MLKPVDILAQLRADHPLGFEGDASLKQLERRVGTPHSMLKQSQAPHVAQVEPFLSDAAAKCVKQVASL